MTRVITIAVLLLIASGPAAAQPPQPGPNSDAKVAALLAAWEKKRNELPVLRYTYTQKQYWPPEFSDSPTGTTSTEDRELTVDWKTGRYRLVKTATGTDATKLELNTQVFDGKTMKATTTLLTKNRQPVPGSDKGYLNEGHLPSLGANEATYYLPYISVGLLVNTGAGGSFSEKLYPPSPEGMLYYSRPERRKGVVCDIYATYPRGAKGAEQYCELAVDPAREQCVHDFSTFVGKSPGLVFKFEYLRQATLLLPSRWTFASYSGGRLVTSLKSDVRVEVLGEVADSTFELTFPDGLAVSVVHVPKTKGMRASTTTTKAVVKDGALVSQLETKKIDGKRYRWMMGLGLAIMCLVTWAALRWRRRTTFKRGVA